MHVTARGGHVPRIPTYLACLLRGEGSREARDCQPGMRHARHRGIWSRAIYLGRGSHEGATYLAGRHRVHGGAAFCVDSRQRRPTVHSRHSAGFRHGTAPHRRPSFVLYRYTRMKNIRNQPVGQGGRRCCPTAARFGRQASPHESASFCGSGAVDGGSVSKVRIRNDPPPI